MKTVFSAFYAALLLMSATDSTYAQGSKFKIGLGLEAALPTGDLSNTYSVGGGLTLRFMYKIDPEWAVTLTGGGMVFAPKNLSDVSVKSKAALNIPVKAGVRYKFAKRFYGMGEAGITNSIVYFKPQGGSVMHTSSTNFTWAPGVGVIFGRLDIGVRYEQFNTNSGFVGLRIGVTF